MYAFAYPIITFTMQRIWALFCLLSLAVANGLGIFMGSDEGVFFYVHLFGCRGDTVEHLDPENSVVSSSSAISKARFNLAAW